MGKAHLKIKDLRFSYGHNSVLAGVNFEIKYGQLVGILGPNGSGKSTLLRIIARTLRPQFGQVLILGEDLFKLSKQAVARQMAVVNQDNRVDLPFTVEEMVLMGRTPHLGRFQREQSIDWQKVNNALTVTNIKHLALRKLTELSGGERQRVMIARALAQDPQVLLLDEPTTHLDISNQIEILELIRELNRKHNLTVVMVIHDLNLASQFCDRLLLLKNGRIYAAGEPEEVITVKNIGMVFGSSVIVKPHPLHRRPQVFLLSEERHQVLQKNEQKIKVHVIGGGGMSASLLSVLFTAGYKVSAGVLNIGDTDWEQARALGIPIAESAPFSPLTEAQHCRNLELIAAADWVILAAIPFGEGNLLNLMAAKEAAKKQKKVIVIDQKPIEERDYTGGQSLVIYKQLLAEGVFRVKNEADVFEIMGREVNNEREGIIYSGYRRGALREE